MSNIFSFSIKNNFSSQFVWVWVKVYFPLENPTNDFHTSLLDSFAETLWTIENKNVSSTNDWVFDDRLSMVAEMGHRQTKYFQYV